MERDPLLTIDEAAGQLRCGRTKLYGLIKDAKLTVVKIGGSTLIRQSVVDRFIAARDRSQAA